MLMLFAHMISFVSQHLMVLSLAPVYSLVLSTIKQLMAPSWPSNVIFNCPELELYARNTPSPQPVNTVIK